MKKINLEPKILLIRNKKHIEHEKFAKLILLGIVTLDWKSLLCKNSSSFSGRQTSKHFLELPKYD